MKNKLYNLYVGLAVMSVLLMWMAFFAGRNTAQSGPEPSSTVFIAGHVYVVSGSKVTHSRKCICRKKHNEE